MLKLFKWAAVNIVDSNVDIYDDRISAWVVVMTILFSLLLGVDVLHYMTIGSFERWVDRREGLLAIGLGMLAVLLNMITLAILLYLPLLMVQIIYVVMCNQDLFNEVRQGNIPLTNLEYSRFRVSLSDRRY